jgi:hypothetical protein
LLTQSHLSIHRWCNEIGVPTSTGHILLLLGAASVTDYETEKGYTILERADYGTKWTGAVSVLFRQPCMAGWLPLSHTLGTGVSILCPSSIFQWLSPEMHPRTVVPMRPRTEHADSGQWAWTCVQNLVWMVKCQIVHGALSGNTTLVSTGFARLWQEIYWAHLGVDNIQRDGSFHQHSGNNRGMMLSGSYGGEFSSDMINLVAISNATVFALPDATLEIFVSLLLDGQQWATTPNGRYEPRFVSILSSTGDSARPHR